MALVFLSELACIIVKCKPMEKSNSVLEKACFHKSLYARAQRTFPVPKGLRATAESWDTACLKQVDKWNRAWDASEW